jgi:hypothetical protein
MEGQALNKIIGLIGLIGLFPAIFIVYIFNNVFKFFQVPELNRLNRLNRYLIKKNNLTIKSKVNGDSIHSNNAKKNEVCYFAVVQQVIPAAVKKKTH